MKPMIEVVDRSGKTISLEEWQKIYGLSVGSNYIGKFFSYDEHPFIQDLRRYGKLVVNELLMRVMDRYRELKRKPVNGNAFNRDQEKQDELKSQGLRAAKFSPHVVKMAVDVDTPGAEELRESVGGRNNFWEMATDINRAQAKLILQAAKELQIKIRVGNELYLKDGATFVHFDVCPEYYAPGMPYHSHPHPPQWEKELRW